MTVQTIKVQGMTCSHCVTAVTAELRRLPGVADVTVELHAGAVSPVTITSQNDLDPAAVASAIDEAGYSVA
jgi:copper chaperone